MGQKEMLRGAGQKKILNDKAKYYGIHCLPEICTNFTFIRHLDREILHFCFALISIKHSHHKIGFFFLAFLYHLHLELHFVRTKYEKKKYTEIHIDFGLCDVSITLGISKLCVKCSICLSSSDKFGESHCTFC